MSNSDDTDILLLIPPDYFMTTEENEVASKNQTHDRRMRRRHRNLSFSLANKRMQEINNDVDELLQSSNLLSTDKSNLKNMESIASTFHAHGLLTHEEKRELNDLNSRLCQIELATVEEARFSPSSDLSSISTCTVRTQFPHTRPRKSIGLSHSTPKGSTGNKRTTGNNSLDYTDDEILGEIDNYFNKHGSVKGLLSPNDKVKLKASYKPIENQLVEQFPSTTIDRPSLRKQPAAVEDNLISLSDLWGKNEREITALPSVSKATLKEEQLRRQHLERIVKSLQTRLLEYQQRLSVAIEVDRAKDSALQKAQFESKNYNMETKHLQDEIQKMEVHIKDQNEKTNFLQKELAQAVSLATKFQEKIEKMEDELSIQTRRSSESNELFRKQLEELEIQLEGCKRSEELASQELNKMRDRVVKLEHQNEKLKIRCDEAEAERSTLRQQKEMLQELYQKQKSRADNLESQRKTLQETVTRMTEDESNLKKKLELQQKALKAQYQQQLDATVNQKVKEFQTQIDKIEETAKMEARERERCLAERAVKQFERLNEKNDLEMNLLQEKHNEEVALYRIQLANASKKIENLEDILQQYKTKRADMAERIHDVMETQWQKALEILTSPNRTNDSINIDIDGCSSVESDAKSKLNQSALKRSVSKMASKENNLNLPREPSGPLEQLKAYVELLLSKSPGDLDKVEEILAMSKSKVSPTKSSHKRLGSHRPPWKA